MTPTQASKQVYITSTQLPDQAYELAAQYSMGVPGRVYKVEVLKDMKTGVPFFLILGCVGIVITMGKDLLRFGSIHRSTLLISPFIMLLCLILQPCMLIPAMLAHATRIYICSQGFIYVHKRRVKAVFWEEVQEVELKSTRSSSSCMVYLTNQRKIKINKHIDDIYLLSQEMKLRAGLVEDADEREWIEQRLARDSSGDDRLFIELLNPFAKLFPKMLLETPDEAFRLGQEHQMGNPLTTYRATMWGIFRFEIFANLVYCAFLLAFGLICLEFLMKMSLFPRSEDFWLAYALLHLIIVGPLSIVFIPRFFARHTRLHVCESGLIYVGRTAPCVMSWADIEKLVYCTNADGLLHPFCVLYLKDEAEVSLSGYLRRKKDLQALFNERGITEPQQDE